MNGKTTIDAIHNPASAEMDRRTYGVTWLNVCFWGKRLMRLAICSLPQAANRKSRKGQNTQDQTRKPKTSI